MTGSDTSTKIAKRISHILALLHQGERVSKQQLVDEFGVEMRTIDRDLGDRLEGIVQRGPDGLWELCQSSWSTVPTRYLHDYARLAGTEQVFPDASLRFLLGQLQTAAPERALRVQPTPHEDLRGSPLFGQLQQAAEQRQLCRFVYKDKPRLVQPYRLLHKNGVWYLAAAEADVLKIFSISQIQDLAVEAERFKPDAAHLARIEQADDIWFTTHTTEVLLRVSPEVAHYFERRQLLPQQTQHRDPGGSLLVRTHINHPTQLLPVVRFWMPHVRIISPRQLHDELVQSLRDTWEQWGLEMQGESQTDSPAESQTESQD